MADTISILIKVPAEDLHLIEANARAAGLSRHAWMIAAASETGAGKLVRLKRELERVQRELSKLSDSIEPDEAIRARVARDQKPRKK